MVAEGAERPKSAVRVGAAGLAAEASVDWLDVAGRCHLLKGVLHGIVEGGHCKSKALRR